MKPLRKRLQEVRENTGLLWEIIERDYILSWVFFDKTLLDYVAKTWEQWLGPLVPELPQFNFVVDSLKQKLLKLFNNT
jgi:hypothetical protein